MKKRILSILLVLVMVVSLVPTAALAYRNDFEVSYAVPGGYIIFDKLSRAIVDCSSTVTEAVIPSEIDGVAVQDIKISAFKDCTNLKSVTVPNSVGWIYGSAFENCTGLVSVKIPNSVTFIGKNAFCGCKSLTSITIPSSITRIENSTFEGCESLTSIVIPDGVTDIRSSAFSHCTNLKSITIPDGVTDIGGMAFAGCTSLTSITIPDSVTSIGEFTFASCTNLTSVSIPNSVTEIGESAFGGCTSLTSIIIPDSVTSIMSNAFSACDSLTSVTIPNSVTEIGYGVFSGCDNLVNINVADDNTAYCSVDGVLFNKNKTELVQYPAGKTETSYTIPNGVTGIGCAFMGCTGLTSVTIPNSVTEITKAFFGCTGLTNVTIPDSVTDIGFFAFRDCTSLTSVTIPNSVTLIEDSAFSGCSSLTDVYYSGSEAQWKKIHDYGYNDELFNARIHYNSVNPITPEGVSDVAYGSYCYDAVQWAVKNGITNGTDSTHFSPNAGCTRAQVVTFLWRAAGEPNVSANVNFVDVSTSSVYYKAIKWAVANGITKGTDAMHFSPNATCTRGQVVTFMYRAAGETYFSGMGSFVDVSYGSYCYSAVQWAVANGITKGTDSTHFSPNATCTRGQVVTFLYRAQ